MKQGCVRIVFMLFKKVFFLWTLSFCIFC